MSRRARRASFDLTTRRKQASVYRAYDVDGRLLYVGCTVDPKARLKAHSDSSTWWRYVDHVDHDAPLPFDDARAAERAAILAERPWFNGTTEDQTQLQQWRGKARREFFHRRPCECDYPYWPGEDCPDVAAHESAALEAARAADDAHGAPRDTSWRHCLYLSSDARRRAS